ncbi:MAG: DUF975 family protein [Eubacterium sp.]|nr:DUF975 family protein [Eubacterium sp.]
MNLDRPLIKLQARQLIKDKVIKLFVIQFIIALCISFVSGICSGIMQIYYLTHGSSIFEQYEDMFDDYFDMYDDYNDRYYDYEYNYGYGYDYDDRDYFDDFGQDDFNSDFHNFGKDNNVAIVPMSMKPVAENIGDMFAYAAMSQMLSTLSFVCTIILGPLDIVLAGYFVLFVRGRKVEIDDGIKGIFKNTFHNNYGKKLGLYFLRSLITGLLACLFIIPGIVFMYSSYFAFQIMCDYPELSPMQAIRVSKKMVRGNRTELFIMNLSFIPWYLLCIFIFPVVYVWPYVATTDALYYENFRLRALQQGRITEDDFLTDEQRYAKYAQYNSAPNYNNQYYAPNNNGYTQQAYYNASQQAPYQQAQGAPYNAAPQQPFAQQQEAANNPAPQQQPVQTESQQETNAEPQPQPQQTEQAEPTQETESE